MEVRTRTKSSKKYIYMFKKKSKSKKGAKNTKKVLKLQKKKEGKTFF